MTNIVQIGRWLSTPNPGDEVVITGISGRFPKSGTIREFQDNLFNKKDMVTDDDTKWKFDKSEVLLRSGKISNTNKFDAGYFGLHYRQTEMLNPIIRKLLETATEAIIDAGLNPSELAGTKTMVSAGISYFDSEVLALNNITEPQRFGITGFLKSFIAHRLSYHLKLKGPSYVVDSGCSSSMNALEHAFTSIRTGKCDFALVGGGNLILDPNLTADFFRLGLLSSDGVCKVFDQNADGYVRSEAVVCVFLQKAKNARRIYAEIIHAKINCDGFKDLGIAFPSAVMQNRLITESLEESGVHPSEVDFLEAHGTGTKVGDVQEIEAIDNAIAKNRKKPLLVGAVKSNIGHTEGAAGLSSLVKAIIAMETGYISPNINLNQVKKELTGINEGRIKVVTDLTPLDRDDAVIEINNFGIGGSNSLSLVKRFGKRKTREIFEDDIPRLVCVSGRTKEAVLKMLTDFNTKPLDVEYVGLLHQIFKKEVPGHLYRGFTIVSKTGVIETEVKYCPKAQSTLGVVLGQFEAGYKNLDHNLRKFSSCKTIFQKNGVRSSFALQAEIMEMLKFLGVDLQMHCLDSVGKLIEDCSNSKITILEALHQLETNCHSVEKFKNMKKLRNLLNTYLVLNISDTALEGTIRFGESKTEPFLEVMGRLYNEGYNLKIHKLYPKIQYPVSRSTPTISSSIQWNYQKTWYTYKNDGTPRSNVIFQKHSISPELYDDNSYLLEHVINGKNFIPVGEILWLVWKTFCAGHKKTGCDLPIIFENCNFENLIEIKKNYPVDLMIMVQKNSGSFKVVEEGSIVTSGRLFFPEDIKQLQLSLPGCQLNEEQMESLNQKEIYQKFSMREHCYSGVYKSIEKCNFGASAALITWKNNWSAFIENLLQLKLLHLETTAPCIITSIQKLSIDIEKHTHFTRNNEACPAHFYEKCNVIKSGGVEICSVTTRTINKVNICQNPVLQKYLFVANKMSTTFEDSVRINVQIIVENSLEEKFKVLEIVDEFTENSRIVIPVVSKVLQEITVVVPDLTISSKNSIRAPQDLKVKDFALSPASQFLLIIATNIFQRPKLLKQALESLRPNGFLLNREKVNFVLHEVEGIQIITEHVIDCEKLLLCRKSVNEEECAFIEVSSSNFDWMLQVQKAMTKKMKIAIFSQDSEPTGLLGLVNCIRREPKRDKIGMFWVLDAEPKFDIRNPIYHNQIKKNLAINVFKDRQWGTYRHLNLEHRQKEPLYSSAEKIILGKNPSSNDKTSTKNSVLLYPFYTSLKCEDVMKQSHLLEFSGQDNRGFRIMGIIKKPNTETMMDPDTSFLWQVPDNWSLEEALTVPFAYSTALHVLFKVIDLKPKMTVLIHLDQECIGLAALNICLYYSCKVYLNIDLDQASFFEISSKFQIPENQIGCLSNLSFQKTIKTETNGFDLVLSTSFSDNLEETALYMSSGSKFVQIRNLGTTDEQFFNLFPSEKNISYHSVILDATFFESLNKSWMISKFQKGIDCGYLRPLPKTVFQSNKIVDGYEHITSKQESEKNSFQIRHEDGMTIRLPKNVDKKSQRFCCDPKKSYIILGGLGGFGLELADWLCSRGATKILLVSRRGLKTGYQVEKIKKWRSRGVTVQTFTGDVSTKQVCLQVVSEGNKLGPIDAIFNLAVVLKDSLFQNQNAESFASVFAPKRDATRHFDQITRQSCPQLRHFVTFSSMSCGLGNAGQTNYGMANSVIEEICEKRKKDGLPALAIQWGPIADVGMAVKLQEEKKPLIFKGILYQKISSCLEVLDIYLVQDNPIVSSFIIADKNPVAINETIVDAASYILGIKNIKTVNPYTSFGELGLDSISCTEMINVFKKDFDLDVTAGQVRAMTFARLIQKGNEKRSG